jgi:hypothetical protein
LDVKIISPPHMVLAAGIIGVHLGTLILILGRMNHAATLERARLRNLYLYVGGMILVCLTVLLLEMTFRSTMHTVHFYHLLAMVTPLVLAAIARGSAYRWAAMAVAAAYSVFVLLMSWILPLFPAQPKLVRSVYHQLTQFTPPEFPFLVIVPALALDLLWQRTGRWGAWRQALVSGVAFLVFLTAAQWPFAYFLMSPAARNWFFGAKYFGYYTTPGSMYARHLFFAVEAGAEFWRELALTLATAIFTTAWSLPQAIGCSAPEMKIVAILLYLAAPVAALIAVRRLLRR